MYKIAHWNRYEPGKNAKKGDTPLGFVKFNVHGHQLGAGYRKLMMLAKRRGPGVFGLFSKLLELAADEPRERRDGTIFNNKGEPATAEEIAFEILFPLDLVQLGLELLQNPEIGWLKADFTVEGDSVTTGRAQTKTKTTASPQTPSEH